MADYELSASDDATMQLALNALNMTQREGRRGIVRYSVNYYGTKYVGAVAQPGVYAIMRWVPASVTSNPFPPAGLNLPAGFTATTPLPANTPIVFFG